MKQTPLSKAIAVAGTQAALAEKIGTTQQNVSNWLRNFGGVLPDGSASFAPKIELAVDGAVTREELCPTTFGVPRPRRRAPD